MAHASPLIGTDIDRYLELHEHKSLLRFITCGSVDDGKSTLIGRLLYESKMLFEDQLAALEDDSKKSGTQGGELDFALLVDGLSAEREQGITIDVAYRFFSTEKRKFIVADTPGHEQYTRNMATGASTADVAIILVDARHGVLVQTRRHSYIVSLLGIRKVVLAINKMDAVGYAEERFNAIDAEYRRFAAEIGLRDVLSIPMSALRGDNVTEPSKEMPWYAGPALLHHLEHVEIDDRQQRLPMRMPVQWVNRPSMAFRGFVGTVASGVLRPGDAVRVLPSGQTSTIARIVTEGGDLPLAVAGQSITITTTTEIDVSRGDVLADAAAPPAVADELLATLVWMHEEPLSPGRSYFIKIGACTATARVRAIRHQVDMKSLAEVAADRLELNGIGLCELVLDRAIAFDPYGENRETGGFVLIDKLSNDTVAAGLIQRGLAHTGAARELLRGCVVWLSGPAARVVAADLVRRLRPTAVLLDDNALRGGLNFDLRAGDDAEAVRRITAVADLLVASGLVAIVVAAGGEKAQLRATELLALLVETNEIDPVTRRIAAFVTERGFPPH